jgi:hypothetical protein
MPLSLEDCGNLGGDVEMAAVVGELARRHPADTFVLLGRNTGERPTDAGLPGNVVNPWLEWGPKLSRWLSDFRQRRGRDAGGLTIEEQLEIVGYLDDLTLDAFRSMDAHVVWLGQHGTSNFPIPRVDDRSQLTKPQDWCLYYASFILRGLNAWREVDPLNREEVYLNADARNEHKMRDLKWPLRHPVLAQYDHVKRIKHERYGDTRHPSEVYGDESWHWGKIAQHAHECRVDDAQVWTGDARSVYSRLEVNGLAPGTPFGDLISYDDNPHGRAHFGMFINEARAIGINQKIARKPILRDWVLPLDPHFLHGTWSEKSLRELGVDVKPAPWDQYYPKLHSVRCTFTTPSSGSGWATAKPWEAFAGGTVCFFHPAYDSQDHILSDADPHLRNWLRVKSPKELKMRVDYLESHDDEWRWLVRLQREHFDRALEEKRYLRMIEERIW